MWLRASYNQSLALPRPQPPISTRLSFLYRKGSDAECHESLKELQCKYDPVNRKLMQRYKNILPKYPGYFFSSLSPPRFSLSRSHFLSLSLEKWKTTSTKKISIEKQHKGHPSHLSGWRFKGALPTCNPVVCFKNSVCPRKKRRANPGSRSFPKGSFFLSLQPGAFA